MKKIINIIYWILIFFYEVSFSQPTAAFFYGKTVPTLQLCMYDIVVVDPYSNFDPNESCNSISIPLAYVSLGEVAGDAPYEKNIRKEWVIGKNKSWNNNLVIDQTQKEWQEFFLTQLIEPLWQKGYRGFFLDTLDSYFLATHDPLQQQKQIEGIVSLIQQIKKRHPDAKIILNRGFQLLPYVHSQIDAVVIESLYNSWNQAKGIYEETPLVDQKMLLNEINKIQKAQLPIIVIDYLPPDQQNKAQSLAERLEKQGLIPWITDKTLQKIYLKKIEQIRRHILIIFNNADPFPLQSVARLGYIDTVLEYMGYITDYFNIHDNHTLPTGDLSQHYAGIILHIDNESPENEPLIFWVQKQIAANVPIVFTNNFAVPRDSKILTRPFQVRSATVS